MNTLQVGFARLDATPMRGVGMPGYYEARFAQGVLDPVELNAVAFACGDAKAILITMDQEGLTREACLDFKAYIAQVTGLSPEAVYLHATHSHTGPAVTKDSPLDVEREYYQFVYRRMGDIAQYALEDLKPAKMGYGTAVAPELAFVRRFLMEDGSIQTNPGRLNPRIKEPVGTADHQVNVLRFDREGGSTIVLANYGNHPDVISGCRISADWPGFTRRAFEQSHPDVNCVFCNGAQGDVNHVNVRLGKQDFNNGYEYAKHMGRLIADTILQAFARVTYTDVDSLRFKQKTIQVATNMPEPKDMANAYHIKALYDSGRTEEIPYSGMMYATVLAEALRMVKLEHGPEYMDMEISAIAIGNVVLIGLPGEPFTGIGRGLKEAPGWDMVLPTCLTNGIHGYFPMMDAYAEGGYEARSSEFRAGVAEQLIEEGKQLMDEVR